MSRLAEKVYTQLDMSSFVKLGGVLDHLPAFVLVRAWKEAAGPALLKHTEFMGVSEVENGVYELKLRVFDAIWHQELEFQKEEILKRYNEVLISLRYERSRLPKRCSLTHTPPLPVKALHPQNRWNKKRIP